MQHDERPQPRPEQHEQPDPDASSDGDRSWTDDPASGIDPDEDRSVEAVIARETRRGRRSRDVG